MRKDRLLIIFFISIILFYVPINKVNASSLDITTIDCKADGESTLLKSNDQYLLMDTCKSANDGSELINYLKDNQIKNLSIYISHYHIDHYGGLMDIINDSYFNISKIFLPKNDYIINALNESLQNSDTENYDYFNNLNQTIQRLDTKINQKGIALIYLSVGDKFNFGDSNIEIIGPRANITLNSFNNDVLGKKREHYINSKSLVTMVTVGNTKYFTAGDIEREEEAALLYSNIDLSANIMKISHHGGPTSNILSFIQKINPTYAFYSYSKEESFNSDGWTLEVVTNFMNYTNANVYSTVYNGTTTFSINDNVITVNPTKNYKTIRFNYLNESNIPISDIFEYKFNDSATYHIVGYRKRFIDYTYDKSRNDETQIITSETNLSEDKEYNLYYKIKNLKIENLEIKNEIYPLVEANTTLEDLEGVVDGDLIIKRRGVSIYETSKIATSDIFEYNDETYILVVIGDMNCDGEVTNSDLTYAYDAWKGKIQAQNAIFLSGDSNKDGRITNSDLSKIYDIWKNQQ